jgi:hypothetical protein
MGTRNVSTIERSQKDKTFGFLGFGISGHLAVDEMSELTWQKNLNVSENGGAFAVGRCHGQLHRPRQG